MKTMKFMLIMNAPRGPYQVGQWAHEDVKRMVAYMHQLNADLKSRNQFVVAEGLTDPSQARIVRADDDGQPSVTDGPFAESKEFIAGFWIVDVRSAEEAYAIAARASAAPGPGGKPMNNAIEVRAVGTAPA
jgi:hypothetical protein